MKKNILFLLICLLILPNVYADNISGVWSNNRTIEFGLNVGAGFSNDFLSTSDVFQKTFVLDIDKFADGIGMNFGFDITPLYFSFNSRNNWGFGVSTGVQAFGIVGLSGKMLSFSQAVDEKSDISAAVFAEVGIPAFFHVQNFKIKLKPSVYYPIAYMESDLSYTFTDRNGTVFLLGYDVNLFTAFSMEDSAAFGLTARPGIDFSIGAEYPLSEVLGLNNKLFFLNFDVGLDLVNIPLVPSSMNDYMRFLGRIGSNEPINFDEGMDDFFAVDTDTEYGEKQKRVVRPFKMLAWAGWRPFGNQLLTVTPTFGFAINPLYTSPFSLEAGVKGRLNLINIFYTTVGVGYHDRLWINSLDLAINLKFFELNIGADLRSPNFSKSWTGGGFGANVGLKFGG
jgi:hypothetical protein